MPRGLSGAAFRDEFLACLHGATDAHVLTAKRTGGTKRGPVGDAVLVGLVVTRTDNPDPARAYQTVPRLLWLPWASSRNKVECVLRWVTDLRKTRKILFHGKQFDRRYLDHLCRYGVMRGIGFSYDYFAPGQDAFAYESRLLRDG